MALKNRKSSGLRRSIHVFDLDDTLIQTRAKIGVCDSKGRKIRALTPSEFTTHVLQPGESFDFRDFSDIGILAGGIVLKYTRTIIETLVSRGTRSDFGILTARGDKRLHAPFLVRLFSALFGIRLRNSLIFNLSDERFLRHKESLELPGPFRGRRYAELSVPERKALVIAHDLIAKGYNDVSLYDDSRENLAAFKVIREAFPGLVYKPHFIDPTWRVRLEEFRRSSADIKTLTRGRESAGLILENQTRFCENPEAGLKILDEGGEVPVNEGDILLRKTEGKFALFRVH